MIDEPAFPISHPDGPPHPGMSLRDWFAGQALAGICNSEDSCDFELASRAAYRFADEMLAKKKKYE